MKIPTGKPNIHTALRNAAELLLKTGAAPAARHSLIGVEALQLLHKLSSDPASAGDALKLLHELQVHQVELDMQYCEFEANEQAGTEDLTRYKALFDFAPMGYFVVDFEGAIIEANFVGSELLGIERNYLNGRHIDAFLTTESRPRLHAMLKRLGEGGSKEVCEVHTDAATNYSRQLQITAKASPDNGYVLLACDQCRPAP